MWERSREGEREGYQVTALGMPAESSEVQRPHAALVAATQSRKQASMEISKETRNQGTRKQGSKEASKASQCLFDDTRDMQVVKKGP